MIIPLSVEKKIRQLCTEVHNVEWSGILFYDYEGTFEDGNLVIKCKDFLLMDIGSSAYTEFENSKDILDYSDKHPELDNYLHMQGLIHSHNNMSTFFSGTDISTLQEWGAERNNFVSLIVNNAGVYTAAITRKISYTRQVKETFFTKFFGEANRQGNREYNEEQKEKLEYYILEIVKEEDESTKEVRERIEEIRKRKEEAVKIEQQRIKAYSTSNSKYPFSGYNNQHNLYTRKNGYYGYGYDFDIDDDDFDLFNPKDGMNGTKEDKTPNEKYEGNLFSEYDKPSLLSSSSSTRMSKDDFYDELELGLVHYDEKIVQDVLSQLLTCSPLIGGDATLNVEKWVKKMPDIYTKRFGKPEMNQASDQFMAWSEFYIDYLLDNVKRDDALAALHYDDDETLAILAYDLIEKLRKLTPKNVYINTYIEGLEFYLNACE